MTSCEEENELKSKLGKYDSKETQHGNKISNFERKKTKIESNEPIVFQHFEIIFNHSNLLPEFKKKSKQNVQYLNDQVPTILAFGITEKGHSIACHIHGFRQYFYIRVPSSFHEKFCDVVRNNLNKIISQKNYDHDKKFSVLDNNYVTSVKKVSKNNIYGHHFGKKNCHLKIEVAYPSLITIVKKILGFNTETNLHSSEAQYNLPNCENWNLESFESDIKTELRFMVDKKMFGCSWLEISSEKYFVRKDPHSHETSSQIEIDVLHDDIISHLPIREWSKMSNYRILSFDIECLTLDNRFPKAEQCPVITIACVFADKNNPDGFYRTILTLNSCEDIVGVDVYSFNREEDLLMKFTEIVTKLDPDFLTGYNVQNFDIPYLIERSQALKIEDKFCRLGKMPYIKTEFRSQTLSSKQMGTRDTKITDLGGRNIVDVLLIVLREKKLRSYKLNSVAYQFLGDQKHDVHHTTIPKLFRGGSQDRKQLALYCLKDAQLPLQLLNKLMLLTNTVEMSRVTGVPVSYLMNRGQSIKCVSQILREALDHDLLFPDLTPKGSDDYEGAIVIEPDRGFYNKPIATLDFASLYPSIMIAYNLCYTTLLTKAEIEKNKIPQEDYFMSPTGEYFLKQHVKNGLLPYILNKLLSERKEVKLMMKNEIDPFKKQVLDGRQLSLKITANSIYGFTGSQIGRLPCISISQSITSYGREMIMKTKKYVQYHYSIANGYAANCKVIYGDTDSVMCDFGVDNLEKAIELGKEAASIISDKFSKPIKLEFEKVYFPMLLINKKRYAGLLYTSSEKYDRIDTKGLETVRRDNCQFVTTILNSCLNMLLIDKDPDAAIAYCKSNISDLLQYKIDMSHLVVTKEITKTSKEYANKQPHTELADKMAKRDPGSAPSVGDRVPYVIVMNESKKLYEKAENPLYALENNIPIDTEYYLNHQLKNPLLRLFEPIYGSEKEAESKLLKGEHTRIKKVMTSKIGGLSNFMIVKASCINCNNSVSSDKESLCKSCSDSAGEIYCEKIGELRNIEYKFNQLWTQCQRCQGNSYKNIPCNNDECPIFYQRQKARIDIEAMKKKFKKLLQ